MTPAGRSGDGRSAASMAGSGRCREGPFAYEGSRLRMDFFGLPGRTSGKRRGTCCAGRLSVTAQSRGAPGRWRNLEIGSRRPRLALVLISIRDKRRVEPGPRAGPGTFEASSPRRKPGPRGFALRARKALGPGLRRDDACLWRYATKDRRCFGSQMPWSSACPAAPGAPQGRGVAARHRPRPASSRSRASPQPSVFEPYHSGQVRAPAPSMPRHPCARVGRHAAATKRLSSRRRDEKPPH